MHILKPRLSEKSYATSKLTNTFAFDVPGELNKHAVAEAVEKQFEVSVTNVRILNRKGKAKRTVRKGGRVVNGRDSDIKKAYVTLAKGNHLPFFEAAEEEDAKQEATQKKLEKAMTKQAEKEAKKAKKESK